MRVSIFERSRRHRSIPLETLIILAYGELRGTKIDDVTVILDPFLDPSLSEFHFWLWELRIFILLSSKSRDSNAQSSREGFSYCCGQLWGGL